ncbi:hypothetical protein D3836_09160 [Streptococcus mutans]|nr:hypothetical protein [Streptococcus mutans]NLQ54137.1 hypothetical protein [Streptococcus mutans]NLQ61966.1 hypothetical protein [Streptococcus mutans]
MYKKAIIVFNAMSRRSTIVGKVKSITYNQEKAVRLFLTADLKGLFLEQICFDKTTVNHQE